MNLSAICYLKKSLLNKLPYYLNWITKFHEFCDIKAETPITSENIDRYLNKLSSIYEPWQIQQASDAVSLYRICQRGKSTPLVQNTDEPDRQWKHVADEMVRVQSSMAGKYPPPAFIA